MPKYKLSPQERAAESAKQAKLLSFAEDYGIRGPDDFKDFFKDMVGAVLQGGLEAELDEELRYSKYDYRNKETLNSRNGYSRKRLKGRDGDLEIKVPRDRLGEFELQIVKKQQTTLSNEIENKIISMYAKGMTVQDISAHIDEITVWTVQKAQ